MTAGDRISGRDEAAGEKQASGVVSDAGRPGRLVVLSLLNQPPERVAEYIGHLVARGDQVELLVARPEQWRELDIQPAPRIHAPDRPEEQFLVRRVERLLVFRVPGAVTAAVERLSERSFARPLRRPAALLGRAQRRVSGAVHGRLFMPAYRALRPLLLSRDFNRAINAIDFGSVDRIVASDVYTVTLGARLAKRFSTIPVTTGMEL
ncbi:hypothetical protein [Micromonospora eburnea]|uniref:Uncharacterized protein n=1 Tax=Micromonospora eburnea TaxID=227316 RepID=A0A1C6U414_9ACTN|nr:hypothetical protein [Micromonospora eburnea]SCL48609.1 hypothetical protein GA0070604_1737 [Micromonospora eburnea]